PRIQGGTADFSAKFVPDRSAHAGLSGTFLYETLRKYVISFETLSDGLFQRTKVRLQSPLRTGFFGSDAFSQVSCALVKILHNVI
ncbi:MAG: hypothetical protein IJ822_06290, partial [Pyramidobacter sp.]|nr:hypothetical protein [Pyramidobacter sp.]